MKRKQKVWLIIILSILVLIGVSYLGISMYIDSMISKTIVEEVEPEDINIVEDITPKAHEVVNFMLVGADNLDRVNGRENSYAEERSDVFKIISLDYTDKKIKIISLDRDVVVWIPDKGSNGEFGRFNWAYSFGQAKYALGAINYNLDLDIAKYITFSFAGFRDVIDIIGGVDIELTTAEANELNKSTNATMYAQEGSNHLDGLTALNYARIRKIDSDFVRMDRQNVVINAVINKFKNCSLNELLDVINKCLPYITTNLTGKEIKDYMLAIMSFDLNDLDQQTYPIGEEYDVCWNKEGIGGYLVRSYSNQVKEIHKFIYGTDDYVPSQRILDIEKKTYETYGDFYEGSELLP